MSSETKMAARTRGEAELLDRPLLARRGATTQLGWCESVKQGIEGGMDRDQLALQMRRQLGDLDAVLRNLGVQTIVAVGVSLNVAIPNLVMDAVNAGYRVVLPRDAVAGIPTEYGAAVITNTLALLATVTSTDALIDALATD